MNAVSAVVFLGLVAICAGHVVAPVQQYYVPTSYSSQYQYVQPSVSGVKYVHQQYAAVPSTQQYVYKTPVSYASPSYYSSPVVASSYGYGVSAYSPSYVYGSPSYVYGYGKK